jgi:hypothetical protein
MAKNELEAIFERMPAWSPEMRRLALDLLLWIENGDQDDGPDDLTDEGWADLEDGLAEDGLAEDDLAEDGLAEDGREDEIRPAFDADRTSKP